MPNGRVLAFCRRQAISDEKRVGTCPSRQTRAHLAFKKRAGVRPSRQTRARFAIQTIPALGSRCPGVANPRHLHDSFAKSGNKTRLPVFLPAGKTHAAPVVCLPAGQRPLVRACKATPKRKRSRANCQGKVKGGHGEVSARRW